jgi:6-phosphogluconolactonase
LIHFYKRQIIMPGASAGQRRILVKTGEAEVVEELCNIIQEKAQESLSKNATFNIGLSGGSMAKFLCQGLPKIETEWSRWRLFFCDERLVPEDSEDSTWGLYKSQLLGVTPLEESQFLQVNTGLSPELAAKDYQDKLVECMGSPPALHLLLLGAGPDGHTCSLFPGHPLLQEAAPAQGGRIVAHIEDSPKPPPARVTLTLPVVNSADSCVFAAVGAGKAVMMKQLLGEAVDDPLPASRVQPPEGEVVWILDSAAAANLNL